MSDAVERVEILIVGSGAGGAVTATALLYRNGGMTPMLGRQSIAFVEGRCVGGSTEINSGFWHRLPEDSYYRWKADELLADFTPEIMEPYFERLESDLSVAKMRPEQVPKSSILFRQGIE